MTQPYLYKGREMTTADFGRIVTFLNAPFGGTKESGTGRENAINVLRTYTEPKTIMVNLTY